MNIKYLRQPNESRQCGQHCLAMLSGKSIEEIFNIIGTKNGTSTKKIIEALDKMNFKHSERLITRRTQQLPKTAICKVRREWNKSGGWHWVLLHNGKIYDPDPLTKEGLKEVMPFEEFDAEMFRFNRKLSSYLEIKD